jgi:hypothetical protein
MSQPSVYAISALSFWLASILFYSVSNGSEQAIDVLSFGGLTFLMVAICLGNEIYAGRKIDAEEARQRQKFAERIVRYGARLQTSSLVRASRETDYHRKRSATWLAALCVTICIACIVGIVCGLLLSDHADMAVLVGGAGIFGVIGGSLMGVMHGHR